MADISVRRLAEKLNSNLDNLLSQLNKAGINKTADDSLTDEESKKLLAFLTKKDITEVSDKPKTLSLKGKRSSEELITNTNADGRKHKIKVVRRKERVVQRKSSLINENSTEQTAEIEAEQNLVTEEVENKKQNTAELGLAVEIEQTKGSLGATSTDVADNSQVVDARTDKVDTQDKSAVIEKKKDKKRPTDANLKTNTVSEESNDNTRGKANHKVKKHVGDQHWDSKRVLEQLTVEQEGLDDLFVLDKVKTRSKHAPAKAVKKARENINYGSIIKNIKNEHAFSMPSAPIVHEVQIYDNITVSDLAQRMSIKSNRLIKALMQMGTMATINQALDQDTAVLLVEEFGHKPNVISANAVEENFKADYDKKLEEASQLPRAPVVTIMGHVDHGKTSLLDYIRRTKVTDKEAGGITQHIGAYSVNTGHGKITFLDTPGHAAFSSMRARGANVTDIVILVVSADDGVMPQTLEAIQHAKAAGVPIVVAVNKIDKPEADPERVKNELTQHGVIPEEWGGENQFVLVSAKTGVGIDNLLDAVLVQTEVLELKAPVDVPAKGIVIEARLDKGRGVVATILVQKGTINKGDIIVAGSEYGRVRAMVDAAMQKVDRAYPSDPVEVLGLSTSPKAGDEVIAVETERHAREISMYRQSKLRLEKHAKQEAGTVEDLFSRTKDSDQAILNVIVKADVHGSAEAIVNSLEKISTSEAKVKIIGVGVGGINESDVTLAMASKAIIIGFNVRADNNSKKLAEIEGVKITYESIIYNVIDDIKSILSGMLSPEIREEIVGLAEVRDVFRSSKFGAVAGCMVVDGIIKRNNPIRVLRDNIVIYEGQLESLRRFKEDVGEVKQGMECGIAVKNYNDVKAGDNIEVFKRIEVERTL